MTIPKLKRIKVSNEAELRTWLAKTSDPGQDVMIVTCDKTSKTKFISRDALRDVLAEFGWLPGMSFTLNGGLVGHVVRHP